MSEPHNPQLTENSRKLRKNMTEEERKLWYCFLKNSPLTFHRQKVIGRYIVDFCCPQAKIIIELDGSQHYEDEGKEKDTVRDKYLQDTGYKVLRYSNLEVNKNFKSVCADIERNLKL